MKMIDKLLSKIGLVRKSRHESIVDGHVQFTRTLGEAAKVAGVEVVLDNQYLENAWLHSDLFVLGNRNVIRDCNLEGGALRVAPGTQLNIISGLHAFPRAFPEL